VGGDARAVRGASAGADVVWAGAPGLRVVRRQAPKYLQWKTGRVEKSGEPQDWMRRVSPSRREVDRRRQRGRMTRQKWHVGRSTGGSW
jgi:hypothetical protein